MNTSKYLNIINNQKALVNEKAEDLKNLSEDFPYFQGAKMLYLKKLYLNEDYNFNSFLKITAAYAGDRSLLFDYITKIENKDEQEIEVVENTAIKENEFSENKNDSVHQILRFKENDRLSFVEWLQLMSTSEIENQHIDQPNDRETENLTDNNTKSLSKNDLLVDKFINSNPTLKPKRTDSSNYNIATSSVEENDGWMTETLAQVYVEQKKYSKAIKAYRILGLKYPEKSGFFADRIRSIEKLINN